MVNSYGLKEISIYTCVYIHIYIWMYIVFHHTLVLHIAECNLNEDIKDMFLILGIWISFCSEYWFEAYPWFAYFDSSFIVLFNSVLFMDMFYTFFVHLFIVIWVLPDLVTINKLLQMTLHKSFFRQMLSIFFLE